MTSRTEINTRVLGLIARYARENPEIDLDTPVDELAIDSLAMFEIVYELEECFTVELDEITLGKIATIRQLADAIRRELDTPGCGDSSPRAGG